MLKENPENITYLIYAGSNYKFLDFDAALDYLKKAYSKIFETGYFKEKENQGDILNLANEFFALSQFEFSEKLYSIFLSDKDKIHNFETYLKYLISSTLVGKNTEANKFLEKIPDLKDLSIEEALLIAKLFEANGLDAEAINFVYEIRRKFFNNPIIHAEYINLNLWINSKNSKNLRKIKIDSTRVNINTVVFLESGMKFIIEDRYDVSKERKEINSICDEYQSLIGRSVNEKVKIHNIETKIVSIKTKYINAFEESLEIAKREVPQYLRYFIFNVE